MTALKSALTALSFAGLVALTGTAAAGDDPAAVIDRADVLRHGVTGVAITAVHEVVDTSGQTQRQVYSVLNHVPTGNSFIVLSSDSAAVNGTVFLIKGGTLYAATPNQRSFVRLGGLNLDRRISGSLFSHWDLQGNVLLTKEYAATVTKTEGGVMHVDFAAIEGSHYKKIEAALDTKSGLFTSMDIFDDQGLLKRVSYAKPRSFGAGTKRKVPTLVEMKRADGRSDLPVATTAFKLSEVEFDPQVDYGSAMAVTDGNLQKLRSQYVLSSEAFRALVAEVSN
jgi:hypothetical protein